jgi:uncharacterized protein (TIGR00255 family)
MLKSMTGYGRGSVAGESFTVTIEMRSVNNRNLDIHWRGPQELASLEIPLKKQVQAAISRGRVDVTLAMTQTEEVNYVLNRPLIRGYLSAMRSMSEEFGLTGDVDLATISRLPGALQPTSSGNGLNDALSQGIEQALTEALTNLIAMRAVEGHELQKELVSRLERMAGQLSLIDESSGPLVDRYREKVRARIEELIGESNIDEGRLAQEIAYLAERSDITEEITRLRSHLSQLTELIQGGGEIGKKLDFILQETNREANTILSKSSELTICDAAIEIKSDVEKLREQALNVE